MLKTKNIYPLIHLCKLNCKNFSTPNPTDGTSMNFENHQYQARTYYKTFSQKFAENKANDYELIKKAISNLKGCKLGITLSDPSFFPFLKDLNKSYQRLNTFDNLLEILREMYLFEFRAEAFWNNSLNFVWELKAELWKHEAHLIGFFYILMQCPYKENFLQKNPTAIADLHKFLLSIRTPNNNIFNKLSLEAIVELLTLNKILGLDNQIHEKSLQQKLMPRYKEILKKSSPYFLSNISYILYSIFFENNQKKEPTGAVYDLITELNENSIYNDLAIYDTNLQNYEFSDVKPDEIGFKDELSYRTLVFLLQIFKDSRFYNEELLIRIEDAIIRKSETDIVDLQNGPLLLFHLSRFKNVGNVGLMRLIEMMLWVIEEESQFLNMYLNKKNILTLVDAISVVVFYKNIEENLSISLLDAIAKNIEKGPAKSLMLGKFSKDEAEFLIRAYSMEKFGGKFKGFVNFLNNNMKFQ